MEKPIITNHKLRLPSRLDKALKIWCPFYRIPKLDEYRDEIIAYSKENNILPFYAEFDMNNDGFNEIILVQKALIGGFGRLLIIGKQNGRMTFDKVTWRRPVNAQFFDYLIEESPPRNYERKGFTLKKDGEELNDRKNFEVVIPHIVTKGYENRVVYWNGKRYHQEKISIFNFKDNS